MRVLDMFPSKYLKAADLGERPQDVTITRVEVGTVGEGDDEHDRPIVYFDELDKGLCLNVTNAKRIVKLYGEDDKGWKGQRITIYPSECDYKGDTVPCIRVKPNAPVTQAAKKRPTKRPGR